MFTGIIEEIGVVGSVRRRGDGFALSVDALRSKGIEMWLLPAGDGGVNLKALLRKAAQSCIQSILVEGGGRVATSLMRERLVDKAYVAVVPRILGGSRGVWPGDVGVKSIMHAIRLKNVSSRRLGDNILVEGYF